MRLIKKTRWLKTFLAAILIISMVGQSLTAYAETQMATGGLTDQQVDPNNEGDNLWNHTGWIVSIQTVENTATDTSNGYAESDVSFENAWLNDFPTYYYSTDRGSLYSNPEKYAFITDGSKANSSYRVASPTGNNSYTSAKVTGYASGKGTNNFEETALLLEKSEWYDDIITGLQSYSLTSDYIIYAASNSSISLDSAIKSFVGLWKNPETAATRINKFVLDDSLNHWEQTVRYLDLLIIVNAMCNYGWSNDEDSTNYIQYYLDNLNADGSENFVAVVVAAAANCESVNFGTQALMTLPVYYGYRTGSQPSTFSHWDGSGDFSSIQNALNNNYTETWSKMGIGNTNLIWWSSGLAASVYPLGADGSTKGYCGYTYIAPTIKFEPEEIINPPSSSPSSPSSSVAATDVVTPTFTVEVTTENEYMQRDKTQPVTATVTIDMGQTDAVQKTFKNIYTSLKNSDESYKTVIEVFVERTFSDGSGKDTSNAVMDSDASGGYFASAVQPTLTSAVVYRWQGTDWDSGSNSSITALPASPPANPRTTTTPPSRQTEQSSF